MRTKAKGARARAPGARVPGRMRSVAAFKDATLRRICRRAGFDGGLGKKALTALKDSVHRHMAEVMKRVEALRQGMGKKTIDEAIVQLALRYMGRTMLGAAKN
eukprot:TRINITY_DN1129_c0_g1_i1.p3 TRINITY_DN1129_c0_g1~~TRINITY_DN1129_c0_g1_i1.p3  ORF type:complete len:103 (+),score=26.67 TRINITY_DN1129_c0_g1_i1:1414-1722(+)